MDGHGGADEVNTTGGATTTDASAADGARTDDAGAPPTSGRSRFVPSRFAPGTDRWWDASAALGALVWVALVATGRAGPIERWLLLAVLVVVPLALPLVAARPDDGTSAAGDPGTRTDDALPRRYRLAAALQPPAALAAAASGLVTEGSLAGALALPWLTVTLLLAAHALGRFARRGPQPAEEVALEAGLLYLVVGAAGVLADRLALSLGFRPAIVHLSAVHFHYAGLLVPLHAAMAGRLLPERRRAVRVVAAAVAGSPLVVATGFAALPLLQFVGAVAVAAGALGAAALALVAVRDSPSRAGLAVAAGRRRAATALLAVAALALAVSMPLAVAYGYGATVPRTVVTISEMLRWHGRANAVGFGLAAVVAWRLLAPAPRATGPDPPLSRLRAGWRVGSNFFERWGVVDVDGSRETDSPPGQLDDLGAYASAGFDPGGVHSEVRRFYERSGEYALAFDATWHRGFRVVARLASRVTACVGQLHLPPPGAAGPWRATGQIVALDAAADGRAAPRGWVRTYARDGSGDSATVAGDAIFVSAYAAHERDGERFLNVALPLPWATLSAVLRFETPDAGDGLALTSAARGPGDEPGLYLTTRLGTVRLPMHERFQVEPVGGEGAAVIPDDVADALLDHLDATAEGLPDDAPPLVARHRMWLLGRPFLTVEYAIRRADDSDGAGRDS